VIRPIPFFAVDRPPRGDYFIAINSLLTEMQEVERIRGALNSFLEKIAEEDEPTA
jgi:hypothetical protein